MRRNKGLASSDNRDAYMYYNPILRVNINMHTRVTFVSRRRSSGSAWLCHVALRATSHPRGSRAINKPLYFFIFLNDLNSKINSEKSEKIPENYKIHNFQNITPNFFHLI